MNGLLLKTASAIALLPGTAFGAALTLGPSHYPNKYNPFKSPNILYSQNSNYAGGAVNSQNFTDGSFTSYSDQAADDFAVPSGQVWKITEVDVSGRYYNNTAKASSENVIFYKNENGKPGTPVMNGMFANLIGTDSAGNFLIELPGKGLKLGPGRYWVSVIINLGFYEQGDLWGWDANRKKHGKQAMWQNPEGGFGYCQTWDTIENCAQSPGPDLMFALRGARLPRTGKSATRTN